MSCRETNTKTRVISGGCGSGAEDSDQQVGGSIPNTCILESIHMVSTSDELVAPCRIVTDACV